MEREARPSLVRFLGLNRTVAIVLVSVLLFGLGEQLWSDFMPLYLGSQARSLATGELSWHALLLVGTYTCLRNLFEGFCYIGGGQLTARLGDRGSLILFGVLTLGGYVLFLTVEANWAAVLAALLILGWEPLSVPVTFTTVGSTVDEKGRGMAFALQSIQKRLPKIIGPLVAGHVLDAAVNEWGPATGQVQGMRILVGGALGLAALSLLLQMRFMPHRESSPPGPSAREILRGLDPRLRRLLFAEVFTRWCDWLVRDFVVVYLFVVRGASFGLIGDLFAIQHATALLTYLPIGQLTRSAGLQPFIGLTFVFFALFPLSLALAPGEVWLYGVFIIYGLREIGEPARKALITSLMPEPIRARGVGLYWGLRCFVTCWASLAGAALWFFLGPQKLLYAAFALGCVGAAVFYVLVRCR
jgi:hypothetical protein